MKRAAVYSCVLAAVLVLIGNAAWCQEFWLDRTVRAGPLQVFQDYHDPKVYYYLPDKIRLGTGEDGKPQFGFMKFVSNVPSKPGEEEAEEGEGGGLVTCLVQLGPTEEQVAEARTELRRKVPGAALAGPVIYRSGKFAMVSEFQQQDGDWTTSVHGLGNAPVLDGQKAAVSMRLTKLGAKTLWENCKMANPNISFTFEMEAAGYREPYEAELVADWDQVYKHRDFSAAFASSYLGFQIRDTLDDLRSKGSIKLITKGEDTRLDALIALAYGVILDRMFEKIEMSPSEGGSLDLIDKAGEYLRSQREQSRSQRGSISVPVWMSSPSAADAAALYSAPRYASGRVGAGSDSAEQITSSTATEQAPTPPLGSEITGESDSQPPPVTAEKYTPPKVESPPERGAAPDLETRTPPRESQPAGEGGAAGQAVGKKSEPSFSLLASYRMKQVRLKGQFRMTFNKRMLETQQFPFSENIGNLSRLMKDTRHFREVNLDDPVFKQREISVYLDGQNAADFAKYINYVTVRLRKTHEGGDQTNDEVRIDRANFNQNGNYFKLMYGWKNDKNREKWMNYEYNVVWSFHGGMELDMGWKKADRFAITVTPPYLKRTIRLEADPTRIRDAGVRLITVKLYYDVAGSEQTRQVTLNPASGELSQIVEYVRPEDELQYDYEISWRMKDGRTITTGRRSSTDDFVFCDELPATGGAI